MEKVVVYIDFEAITNPFARLLNLPSGTPFAYTLGLLNDKNQFEVKTFIMDFKMHNSLVSIWTILRKFIMSDIKKINSKVDINNVIFIGHNPVLETKCIKKLFPNNLVKPLIENQTVSLSKLTAKVFKEIYWKKTKKIFAGDEYKETIFKNMSDSNGAIASFAGYWFYVSSLKNLRSNDKKLKYFIKLDRKTLFRELRNYSKDDVNKMIYVEQHPEELKSLMKELNVKKELLKSIKTLKLDNKLTISEIKEKIWTL